MHLQGATAFVTGAAQGFGKAFSEALLSRGASVCLCDLQEEKGKDVEQELQAKYGKDKVIFKSCDVRSPEAFSKVFSDAVSNFGHIDLMVNNAGIGDESRTKDMIDINLFAVIKGSQLAIEHMRKDKGGKGGTVINVASAAGFTPVYFFPAYAATKYGVVGYTESWASNPHMKEMGIQVASLCPSFADTAIIKVCAETCLYPDEIHDFFGIIGITTVDEVTKAFMQLVDNDNCNGDIITVTKAEGVQYVKKNGEAVPSTTTAGENQS